MPKKRSAMESLLIGQMVALANTDGEFQLGAIGWDGRVHIAVDDEGWVIPVVGGQLGEPKSAAASIDVGPGDVSLRASADVWSQLLESTPGPRFTDPWGASSAGMELRGGPFTPERHGAVRRLSELLRHAANKTDPAPETLPDLSRHGQHDHAVGRYIHLDIDGVDYRVYYEEAGSGIPLLCQHTAGADGRQFRHLLEDDRITDAFRVIAYDLPYHGKSLPPQSRAWWAEEYRLTTDFAMQVPTLLGQALDLEDPVFIGSSIGGMLALDLARYHADYYRAVIAVEGGLHVDMDPAGTPESTVQAMSSSDPAAHAHLMMMVMAQPAPEVFRHETWLHYAQGAPGVFPGDLYFYSVDHDLRGEADKIDTTKCAVYLLTGEYDFSTVPWSEAAATAIAGSKYQLMEGLGHFPMSEDPEQFAKYLLPILDEIATDAAQPLA